MAAGLRASRAAMPRAWLTLGLLLAALALATAQTDAAPAGEGAPAAAPAPDIGPGPAPAPEPPPSPPPSPPPVDPLSIDVVYAPTNKGLKPRRLVTPNNTHYYQLADNAKGTLVVFHGCGRTAKAFFPYDPDNCPECMGFPEHVSHTKQALARGYNILAMEPLDLRHLCWSSANRGYFKDDRMEVISVVTDFIKENGLTDLPVCFHGISSGGTMILKLLSLLNPMAKAKGVKLGEEPNGEDPYVLQVHGVICEEAAAGEVTSYFQDGDFVPPIIFIGMERGGARLEAPKIIDWLQGRGSEGALIESPIRRVIPTYLSDRAPTISQAQSEAIVGALREIGMVDEEGWLTGDPDLTKPTKARNTSSGAYQWTSKVPRLLPWIKPTSRTVSLIYRRSLIYQALNVAYARHDAVSDYLTVCLAWLESKGKGDLTELLDKFTVPDGNLTRLTVKGLVSADYTGEDAGPSPSPSPEPFSAVAPAPAAAPPSAAARLAGRSPLLLAAVCQAALVALVLTLL